MLDGVYGCDGPVVLMLGVLVAGKMEDLSALEEQDSVFYCEQESRGGNSSWNEFHATVACPALGGAWGVYRVPCTVDRGSWIVDRGSWIVCRGAPAIAQPFPPTRTSFAGARTSVSAPLGVGPQPLPMGRAQIWIGSDPPGHPTKRPASFLARWAGLGEWMALWAGWRFALSGR
jgi:hypothetical protein